MRNRFLDQIDQFPEAFSLSMIIDGLSIEEKKGVEGAVKHALSSISSYFALSMYCLMLLFPIYSKAGPSPSAPVPASFLTIGLDGSHFRANSESLQQTINEAQENSTILVPAGTYSERVVVNKSLTLVGEANFASVIDGNSTGTVVEITADDAVIIGFKVQNSGYGWNNNGIYAHDADNLTIQGNYLHNTCHNIKIGFSKNTRVEHNIVDGNLGKPTMYGIRVENSTFCTVRGNNVSDCVAAVHLQNASQCVIAENYLYKNDQGIRFYSPCTFNAAYENIIANCNYDGFLEIMPPNNTLQENRLFHNNFVNSGYGFTSRASGNHWDDGYPSGGNYWSRYNGSDSNCGESQNVTGKDGIGDLPYSVNADESDRYPLIHPYGSIRNLQTDVKYFTVQSAINDPETVAGNSILVDSGVYHENVVVNKTVALIGRNPDDTIIDGDGMNTVVTVNVDSVTITGFRIQHSGSLFPPYGSDYGLLLDRCSGCTIRNNRVLENRIGVYLFFSENNSLEENLVEFNSANGICLWYSGGNNLSNNTMLGNKYNFGVFGDTFAVLNNNIDVSNLADGKPVRFMINRTDEVVDEKISASTIYLVNCANVTVKNHALSSNSQGVFCYNVTESTITNVTVWESEYGISLQDSFNNRVFGSNCVNNWVGILLQRSQRITIEDNYATKGEKGISLYEAHGNLIEGNTVSEAYFGIRLYASNNNSFMHNNLINNNQQASIIPPSYQNTWNNSLEGNFWNEHLGSDSNYDGITDDSHIIYGENVDHHPLLGTFHSFQVTYGGNLTKFSIITNSTLSSCHYDPDSRVIRLHVNGTAETKGFCRLAIPHELVQPDIRVLIDNGSTPIIVENLNLFDNGSCRWIYLLYEHSVHEITIIPEYSLYLLILSAFAVSAFSARVLRKPRIKS